MCCRMHACCVFLTFLTLLLQFRFCSWAWCSWLFALVHVKWFFLFISTFQFDCFIRSIFASFYLLSLCMKCVYSFAIQFVCIISSFPRLFYFTRCCVYESHIQIMSTNRINGKMINGFWYFLSFSTVIYINDMAKTPLIPSNNV